LVTGWGLLAFASRELTAADFSLLTVDPNTKALAPLNVQGLLIQDLRWSPDGSRLAFVSDVEGNNEIYVINADGTGLLNLTQDPGDDRHATWASGGTRLAFDSDRMGNRDIFAVDVDGTHLANLTNNPADDEEPLWSLAEALMTTP
jgi:Tol biopolymer transport system component